jgi:putative long chain acyl-CoA synthase
MATALSRLGAVSLVLPPGASDDAIKTALTDFSAKHMVADPEFGARARALDADAQVMVLGGGATRQLAIDGVVDMERIDPAKVVLPSDHDPNPGRARDLAMVLFSDARDGGLRAVRITNGRWAFSALGASAACTLTPNDTVYAALPLHHVAGMLVSVGSALVAGARLALADEIEGGGFPTGLHDDPAPFWREVRRYGATVVFYAGEMCRSLVNAPYQPTDATNPVRLFAGSGMKPSVWKRVVDRFDCGVLEFYASTEGNAVLANASGSKVGALGRPLPGSIEMALCAYDFDAKDFVRDSRGLLRRCGANEPGVLLSRIDATHPAYDQDDPRVVRNVFAGGDRWWRSNDVLEQDRDGEMWFRGRLHEVLRAEGRSVFMRPIEDALDAAAGVSLAVAFVVDGEATAVVVPRDGATLEREALQAALADLDAHQRPSAVYLANAADVQMTPGFRPMTRELRGNLASMKRLL